MVLSRLGRNCLPLAIVSSFVLSLGDVAGQERTSEEVARSETSPFKTLAFLDTGKNPHQISFTADGKKAYIAAPGSNEIAVVDARRFRVLERFRIPDSPLGVSVLSNGDLAIARFGTDRVSRYHSGAWLTGHLVTGKSPSLIVGPLPNGNYLLSAEGANQLWVADFEAFRLLDRFPTGQRPFPPAATSDGRYAFVSNYNDGTVTAIDLLEQDVRGTIAVGERPSGGAVLPGDETYVVAVRGEDRVAFIDTRTLEVTGTVQAGVGKGPFSVVPTADGRIAFINNTGSSDVSVLSPSEKRVVARLKVGEIPIFMALHPSGETLWISCEGNHRVFVVSLPDQVPMDDSRLPFIFDLYKGLEDSEGMPLAQKRRCTREVLELHQFFQGWFNQRRDRSPDFRRFSQVLAPEFEIISPGGSVASRDRLLEIIAEARGGSQGKPVQIWVENLDVRTLSEGLYLVTYEEWQEVEDEKKGRRSSAILREKEGLPNDLEWVHLQETWLP